VIRTLRKQKRRQLWRRKRRRWLTSSSWKNIPNGLDKTKCKHVDELIKSEFSNCFPFRNKPIKGVKVQLSINSYHLLGELTRPQAL
jgi:hypothetical protein